MASINLLGLGRARRKRRKARCGKGWKLNKRRTKCIRKRGRARR